MDTTRFLCVFWMGLIVQAVKVFNKSFLRNEKTWKRVNGEMQCRSAFEKVELEIALMKKLSHPNLVKLIDVIDDEHADRYPLLVYFPIQIIHGYRVCRKGSDYGVQPRNFRVHLSCNKYSLSFPSSLSIETIIPEDKARKYLYDIISGLEYRSSFPLCTYSISPSPQSRSSRHQAREPPPNQR